MTFCHIVARGYFVMIKSTFYNLSDAKRERVIRAIMQEFAGNESEKVSINRIIKTRTFLAGVFISILTTRWILWKSFSSL